MMETENKKTEEEKDILILAIESSCDETAASVVKNGREVLSNVISSQIALHTHIVRVFKASQAMGRAA